MAATFSPEIMQKIKHVTSMNYKDQAIWYLNAFWTDAKPASDEAEDVWNLAIAFEKEDHIKGKNGNELNAVQAFNVLQKRNQTLTALQLKAQLRTVDIDANGEMALAEYLLFINNRDPIAFVTNPQGQVDLVLLKALEEKMDKLSKTFDALQVQLAAEEKAEAESKAAEAAAIEQEAAAKAAEAKALDEEAAAKAAEAKALDEEAKAKAAEAAAVAEKANADKAAEDSAVAATKAKAAEEELKIVEDEARAIEAEIKAQEQAKKDELARLEALSTDQSVGIVKRNMAVQQLAQLKGEDSLPLQKAKLTQEAVVRKLAKATAVAAEQTAISKEAAEKAKVAASLAAEKATAATAARQQAEVSAAAAVAARKQAEASAAAAKAAREAAEAKRAEAVAARQAAEAAKKQTEVQIADCQAQLAEAEVELTKLKAASTEGGQGLMWWQSRILEDKKRSLPQRMW